MATLYVENVPDELYEGLRKRAKLNKTSIASEVIGMIEFHVPTKVQLKKRRELFEHVMAMKKNFSPRPGPFPSTEEMIREDRER
jgi:hypothetical protein